MKYIVAFTVSLHLCYLQARAVVVTPDDSPAAIPVGENVTLNAEPSEEILAGTWNFNSRQIVFWYPGRTFPTPQYEDRIFFDSSTSLLTITSLQVNDSGAYALNGADPDFHSKMILSVQEPISNASMTVTDTDLVEFNDSVTFNCSAVGTPLRFQWVNRTSVLAPSERIQISDDNDKYSVLTITEVTRFDTGPFFCNVSNDISDDKTWLVNLNISYGPSNLTMVVAPDKEVYISGSNITLTCSAESQPAASYMWLFGDTVLNKYGHQLDLTNLKMTQSGSYTCLAHNRVTGRYEKISRSLHILDPISAVSINQMGRPPILLMNFTLSCEVTGPVESIQWMKNNSDLPTDGRISTSDQNKTLTFTPVDKSDNGDYQCMASNAVSSKSNDYTLTVNFGPNMPVISGPTIIASGSDLTLSCSAESWPPSNFTWSFNDLMELESPVYTMTSLRLNNTGTYSCSASNDITNITKTVKKQITVIDLISSATVRITENPPVDQKRFMLTCDGKGTVYERFWMMDGKPLNLSNHMSLSDDKSTLTFDPVLRSDDGTYECMASNPLNNKTSAPFHLTVNYGPMLPVITGPMQPVRAGSVVTLNCSAESQPSSNYTWHLGDTLLSTGWMYVIVKVTPANSGNYTCVATNDVTNLNSSATKELMIIDPITAVRIAQVGEPPINNMTFTLSCNVTGPEDSVHWMKDGKYLQMAEDDRISFSDGNKTLMFRPVMQSDDGNYQCSAFNAVSNYTSLEFSLEVNYGPDNVSISGPSILATGSNVTFSCDASSQPTSNFSWSFKGSPVGMGSEYKKYSLSPADSGEYSCTAHNNVTGHSRSTAKMLTVIDVISKVEVKEADGPPILNKTFTLSCDATGPVDFVHWMRNGTYLHSDDSISFSDKNKTLTFMQVKHSDNGAYQCTAMNSVSKRNSTEYVLQVNYGPWDTVITSEPVAKLGSNAIFTCSATSMPPSVYSWYFNEKMIGEGAMMELTNVTLLSSGNYTCKTHNNVTGMNSSAITSLRVIAPLTVVTVDSDQQPILGRSFQLNCSANSETTIIYWLKDGMQQDGWSSAVSFSEGNASMTMESLTLDDDGDYRCLAHNEVSEKTSPAFKLTVNFGPNNVMISGPERAETGDMVMFNCSAASQPPSYFSWYFMNSTQMEFLANGSSYTTKPLTLESTGKYVCKAHNSVTGLNGTASAELEVFEAITVEVKPNPAIPMDSKDFSLGCVVDGPYKTIQWVRDSRPLVLSNNMGISSDNTTVSFKPLKTANDGMYQCIAENAVRSHTSEPYKLLASYGPNKVVISITTENPFTLTCSASSQPPSTYEWVLDGEIVGNSSKIEMTIFEALSLDNITCVAKNPLTNVSLTTIFQIPDSAAAPLQSQVDLTLRVLLALVLCLLGNSFY